MLRFSNKRYDAEVHFHQLMNLNLIRVWGGALIERPEFYAACDKYGLLVFQDMWGSGDCNGRWQDPMKLDNQWTRRKYPDDHNLYIKIHRRPGKNGEKLSVTGYLVRRQRDNAP